MAAPVGLHPVENPGNRVVMLCGRATLDGSGQAVVATTSTSLGIPMRFSVSRASAGVYTITLSDKYVTLLQCSVTTLVAAATPANRGGVWKVDAETINSTKTITIRNELAALAGSAGVAVDPPNSSVLLITILVDRGRI